jgi:threonine synthase
MTSEELTSSMINSYPSIPRKISVATSGNTGITTAGYPGISTVNAGPYSINGSISSSYDTLDLGDDQVITIGTDFTMTGKVLKSCLKTLLPLAMEEYPEDFV